MPIYELEHDGKIYELEAPENTPDAALIAALRKQLGQTESQLGRSFAQGLTFGFADEIEAGIRSAFSGDEYSEIRDRIRQQLKDYQDANGAEALAAEIAGASIPSLVGFFLPGLGQAATASNASRLAKMASNLKRAAKIGAAEGAIAGAGFSEGESLGEVAGDVATGAALGGTLAPVVGMGVGKGAQKVSQLLGEASSKLGKKGATAVEQELRKIAEATGKTAEEIIADIEAGRLITDNRTLAATIRALSSKSDDAKTIMRESYARRGPETLQAVREARDLSLTGTTGEPPNIAALTDFKDEQKMVGALYREAQQSPEAVSDEVGQLITVIDEMMPDITKSVRKTSEAINKAGRTTVRPDPIMGRKGGVIGDDSLKPTIQQAEDILKEIKSEINGFYTNRVDLGKKYGMTIEGMESLRDMLEASIDRSSPSMRQARQAASQRFGEIDAFKTGRAMARKPSDMQEEMMMKLQETRELGEPEMQRIRQGVSTSLRSRTGTPSEFSDVRALARTDSPTSNLLDMIGATDTDQLRIQAQLADDVNIMRGIIEPTAGSITQFAQAASEKFNQNINPAEILSALNGDVATWLNLGTKVTKGLFKSGLSDQEYAELARLLVSEDPGIIRKALLGEEASEEIARQIQSVAQKYGIIASDTARRATAQQASQE